MSVCYKFQYHTTSFDSLENIVYHLCTFHDLDKLLSQHWMEVPQQKAAQTDIFSNRQHLVEVDRNMEHCMHTIHLNALNITLFSTAIESYIIVDDTNNVSDVKC